MVDHGVSGLFLALLVISVSLIGDGLRDQLDPPLARLYLTAVRFRQPTHRAATCSNSGESNIDTGDITGSSNGTSLP